MAPQDRRIDLGDSLKGSIRLTSDCQNFGGARVLIRELPSVFQADHSCGISHYFFGYRPSGDEPGKTVYSSDTTRSWNPDGRVPEIMDNLIAQGRIVPMVVVMTEGHVINFDLSPTLPDGSSYFPKNAEYFARELLHDVIPLVEKTFRVRKDRLGRAIAGNSMGGMNSLVAGLSHLELFSALGAFSPIPESATNSDIFDDLLTHPGWLLLIFFQVFLGELSLLTSFCSTYSVKRTPTILPVVIARFQDLMGAERCNPLFL